MPESHELPGLAEACARLADGRPVVVPCPSPMTYGIVGPTARLWERFPRLFGSSGNRTGHPAAASAADARAMFGDDAPVVDGDALRDLTVAHTPSTFVRIDRAGAQDAEVTRYTS